jgi:hypothetical protein
MNDISKTISDNLINDVIKFGAGCFKELDIFKDRNNTYMIYLKDKNIGDSALPNIIEKLSLELTDGCDHYHGFGFLILSDILVLGEQCGYYIFTTSNHNVFTTIVESVIDVYVSE